MTRSALVQSPGRPGSCSSRSFARDGSFEFPRLSHPSNATGAGLGSPPPRPSDNASRRNCELPRTATSSGLPAMELRVASNPASYQRPRRFSNFESPRSPISPVAPFDASLELPPVSAPSGLAGDRSPSRPEARILQHPVARPLRVCPAASTTLRCLPMHSPVARFLHLPAVPATDLRVTPNLSSFGASVACAHGRP